MHPFVSFDLASLLDERASQWGKKPILIWTPFEGPPETWSYAEFASTVARVAGGLQARGIKSSDRVLIHLENCPETLIARFACAWLGAVAVITNPNLTGPELSYLAQSSGARAAITQPKLAGVVSQSCPGLEWIAVTQHDAGEPRGIGALPAKSDSFASLLGEAAPRRQADPSTPALIMFTSGTTSRPKGVVWTHANALWGGKFGAMQQGLRSEDICQIFLPLFHVVGFAWSFLPTLWAGGTVVLQPRFSASRYWPVALANCTTIGSQVIFSSDVLSQQPVPRHSVRQWSCGRHMPQHVAHFGVRELTCWGMTELVAQVILGDPWSEQRPGSLGRPSTGYRVTIEDDDGRPVALGQSGHLLVAGSRGVSIFQEYDGDPTATADAFDERGFFRTGDRVILHEDGWIEFADRSKDVIKVGGEGVSAAEIEAVVVAVKGVREAAVVAKPDKVYGEVAVAFVVIDAEAPHDISAHILERCEASLAKFKVPREIMIVPELPRVGIGKIAKAKLRESLRQ